MSNDVVGYSALASKSPSYREYLKCVNQKDFRGFPRWSLGKNHFIDGEVLCRQGVFKYTGPDRETEENLKNINNYKLIGLCGHVATATNNLRKHAQKCQLDFPLRYELEVSEAKGGKPKASSLTVQDEEFKALMASHWAAVDKAAENTTPETGSQAGSQTDSQTGSKRKRLVLKNTPVKKVKKNAVQNTSSATSTQTGNDTGKPAFTRRFLGTGPVTAEELPMSRRGVNYVKVQEALSKMAHIHPCTACSDRDKKKCFTISDCESRQYFRDEDLVKEQASGGAETGI